jgi:hypothetical protein
MRGLSFFLAIYLISLSSLVSAQSHEQAFEETKAEYNSVAESVTKTQEHINEMRGALVKAEKFLKKIPAGPERNKVKRMIRDARKSLNARSKQMGKFNTYASKVTTGLELMSEINNIRKTANSRAGGPLAAQMTYVAEALTRYGEEVPIIGKALKAYGEATSTMLNATDKFAKKVDTQRNQDMIGAGTYNFLFNAKYKAMKKQFGADVADGDTYAPKSVRCVYRSINNPSKAFIWDDQAGEWYKVSNGAANLEQAYREGLLIGKRRSPYELKVLADKWDEVQARRQAADALFDKLYGMRHSSVAFMNVDDNNKGALSELMSDRDVFRAYFSYDQAGRKKIDGLIESVKKEIKKLQEEEKKAKEKRDKERKQDRLNRRKEFLKKQREEYEANHAKKLNDQEQRKVNGLHRAIANAIESIGNSQGRIDGIVSSSQTRIDDMHESIAKLEAAIAAQMRVAADFQQKVSKIIAETKKEETRKKFEKHRKACQEALADQSFCTAHSGGYYDWGVIAFDDLKTHHFGRSIKANRHLIATYQKATQTAIKGVTSGELYGIDRHGKVQVSKSYYYPSSINDHKNSMKKSRELIKARRLALKAFERINTDPEPNWEMPQLVDPSKASAKE